MSAYQFPGAGNTDRKAGSTPVHSARNLQRQFNRQRRQVGPAYEVPDWIEINGQRK